MSRLPSAMSPAPKLNTRLNHMYDAGKRKQRASAYNVQQCISVPSAMLES